MKILPKLLMALCLSLCCAYAQAQIELPRPSPTATLSQKVGLTDVEIVYSRPSVKGREIFGDLTPYGQLWRTGANMATKFTFGDAVKIAGHDLPAGSYALFTIPGKDESTIIFNKNWKQDGTANYKESEDALRVTAKPEHIDQKVESFTIDLNNLRDKSADIVLSWENTVVKIPMEVNIDDRIMASIKNAMTISPNTYYQAATYYLNSGKDLNEALTWIDKAIEMYEQDNSSPYWVYRTKALIQADLKDYKGAIETARLSSEKAKAAGNMDYVKLNEKSVAEWSNM